MNQYLKEFDKVLMGFKNRHDLSQVMADYLSLHLQAWSRDPFPELNDYCQKRYTLEERQQMGKMIRLFTLAVQKGLKHHSWYDGIGTYYEEFASKWKKSGLGQFFTPTAIVDVMSQVMQTEKQRALISEPACGSGRGILSFAAHNPGCYFFAQDIDPICAKMTALNMLHHGVEGVVCCMDTLKMEFQHSYTVNLELAYQGPPTIIYTNKEAVSRQHWHVFELRSEFANRVEEPQEIYAAA